MIDERYDVVIVGGGIAGGALATALARGGRSVLVLERSTEYVDRVRGEYMHPWGVAEARQLGLYDALMGAGGNHIGRMIPYCDTMDPAEAEAAALPLADMLPGVPGPLGVGHPAACRAFDATAVAAGAAVVHGVDRLSLTAGSNPSVTYAVDGREQSVSCRLIVGADGRESTVRRQLGLELHAAEPRLLGAGLLVEGVDEWDPNDETIGTEDDRIFFVFPQTDGRVRLYLMYDAADRHRLAGADKARTFLEGFRLKSMPNSERFSEARAAGPCAVYPMNDTWTDSPVSTGAVLVGDAAGYNDPVIGAGLSIALRDVRVLSDLLLAGDDWSPAALQPYAEERAERMRRLRFCATVFIDFHVPFGAAGAETRQRRGELMVADPELFMILAAISAGPELAPPSTFESQVRERLLAA